MDYSKETKASLISKCKELGVKNYSNKSKPQIIELLLSHNTSPIESNPTPTLPSNTIPTHPNPPLQELQENGESNTQIKFIDLLIHSLIRILILSIYILLTFNWINQILNTRTNKQKQLLILL